MMYIPLSTEARHLFDMSIWQRSRLGTRLILVRKVKCLTDNIKRFLQGNDIIRLNLKKYTLQQEWQMLLDGFRSEQWDWKEVFQQKDKSFWNFVNQNHGNPPTGAVQR